MPFAVVIVTKPISAADKARILPEVPSIVAALKSAPGVISVYAGPIVATNHGPATDDKLLQVIEVDSPASIHALKTSNHFDHLKAKLGEIPEPEFAGAYEVDVFPSPADLDRVFQATVLTLHDPSKQADAQAEFQANAAADGNKKKVFGGKSVDRAGEGIVLLGWAGKEEVLAARDSPAGLKGKATLEKWGSERTVFAELRSE